VPAGEAVKTAPPAGSEVDAGSSVVLTISRGPKQVEVPDIVGLSQADAVAALEGVDLVVGEGTRVEDASPRDTVLDQDPAAGTSVDARTAVDVTLSSGPTSITVPDVKGLPEADAVAVLSDAGLVVASTEQKTNASVPAGEAVKTAPPAGSEVDAGSSVVLTISRGPKQVEVPDIVGLSQADAVAALEAAEVTAGDRSEANDDAVAAGGVVAQDPEAGAAVDKGTPIDYVVSLGPTAAPHGAGGSLESPAVIGQLDAVAAAIPTVRELEVGQMPYDAISAKDQRSQLASRSEDLHDPATLDAEEAALKRMGFLGQGDDLAKLLRQLYGQALPVAYSGGSMDVLQSLDALDGAAEADAARELGRSATDQAFGLDAVREVDPAEGDEALAGVALDEGDGTATMLQWAAVGGADPAAVDDTIVPGDDGTLASMPQVLQREYTLPFLEGRLFVDRLRDAGGWGAVDDAWSSPPESTEQILHPKLYPGERPTSIDLGDLGGTLGDGWSEAWQQTMGEARIAVWLADGQPGTQEGPKAPIKLPKANAAAGWGGDRLVSLDGPGGSWAVVWQTKWDGSEDVGQFAQAATAAIADLPGAHAILEADITAGLSNPVLVILASDADTLAAVGSALGVSP
jgi:beta-lactam-binding protein with PASTA domain